VAGQIIKRGERKFLVRIFLGRDANGKRKYHNHTVHGTKKDAEKYRNQKLRELDIGEFVEPSKELFKDHVDRWLEQVVKHRVREKTYQDYKRRLELYIFPSLAEVTLSQVTPDVIQEIYSNMLERGLSSRSVRYVHTILKNSLNQAVKWGKIYRNPCDLVDLPRLETKEMHVLSPDEAVRFLEATVYSRFKALFSLLITTGMRPGEALALKWPDINLDKGKVTVNKTLTRVKGRGWKLEEPKTTKSRRTIPIPEDVVKDLKEHRAAQAEHKLQVEAYHDHGFVFASETGEPMSETNLSRRDFKRVLKQAGLPDIRLYDLRHTCATLLLAAGENPKIVSERLGHTDITLTLGTYSHVLPDMQEEATEKLNNMLFIKVT